MLILTPEVLILTFLCPYRLLLFWWVVVICWPFVHAGLWACWPVGLRAPGGLWGSACGGLWGLWAPVRAGDCCGIRTGDLQLTNWPFSHPTTRAFSRQVLLMGAVTRKGVNINIIC